MFTRSSNLENLTKEPFEERSFESDLKDSAKHSDLSELDLDPTEDFL
jgi:hypothetical protein